MENCIRHSCGHFIDHEPLGKKNTFFARLEEKMAAKKHNICLVCLDAYPVFNPALNAPFGGAQTMAAMIAKGIHASGSTADMVVYDYGQPKTVTISGVRLLRHNSKRLYQYFSAAALRTRKIQDRLSALLRFQSMPTFYRAAALDVFFKREYDSYLFFGLSDHFNEVMIELEKRNKQWCMVLVHDEDVSANYTKGTSFKNRHGISGAKCFEQLNRTHRFVAQNNLQLEQLKANFKKDGILVKSPIDMNGSHQTSGEFILWVGRPSDVKRPELFVEMATAWPKQKFVLITNDSDQERLSKLRATAPENLEILINVPAANIEDYFCKAKLFVNTATSEGFPITFLHAGKFGVPIATLGVDPDGVLTTKDCGYVFQENENLIAALPEMIEEKTWTRKSEAVKKYVAEEHDSMRVSQSIVEYVTE